MSIIGTPYPYETLIRHRAPNDPRPAGWQFQLAHQEKDPYSGAVREVEGPILNAAQALAFGWPETGILAHGTVAALAEAEAHKAALDAEVEAHAETKARVADLSLELGASRDQADNARGHSTRHLQRIRVFDDLRDVAYQHYMNTHAAKDMAVSAVAVLADRLRALGEDPEALLAGVEHDPRGLAASAHAAHAAHVAETMGDHAKTIIAQHTGKRFSDQGLALPPVLVEGQEREGGLPQANGDPNAFVMNHAAGQEGEGEGDGL